MIDISSVPSLISQSFVKKIASMVLKQEKKSDHYLSIVFVSAAQMRKLNKKHRNKDKATDVLSFCFLENKDFKQKEKWLGEIAICPQVVKKNAGEFKKSFQQEMALMIIHGILHTCGYDHEKTQAQALKMERREQYYLKKSGF